MTTALRSFPKYALLNLIRYLGISAVVRRSLRKRLLVLCYHGVVADERPRDRYLCRNTVSTRELDQQLAILNRSFRPVAISDVLDSVNGGPPLPEKAVLVTFDDGYRNNLTHAAPLLERHGVPALISVSTGYIDQQRILWPQELEVRILRWPRDTVPMPGNEPDRPLATDRRARIALIEDVNNRSKRLPDEARRTYLERLREEPLDIGEDWEDELFTFLSWSDVRSLRRRGFDIGSHTIDHSILSRTSRRQLSHQLRESKAAIERELRTECSCIVYPNGGPSDVSPEVMATARAAGYRLGFILTGRFNSPGQDPLALDRVSIPGHLPPCVFHSIVSGIHHLLGR